MLLCYWLEPRAPIYSLAFAVACWAAASYGWLIGAWPFALVELVWGGVAIRRYAVRRRGDRARSELTQRSDATR